MQPNWQTTPNYFSTVKTQAPKRSLRPGCVGSYKITNEVQCKEMPVELSENVSSIGSIQQCFLYVLMVWQILGTLYKCLIYSAFEKVNNLDILEYKITKQNKIL